ncbi:hypothetical protein BOTCAL_0481g00040 [Botryotinia calthae]|uniref:Uncharacterized protein n=1 Tax=Botryotinia calthae TaxID=38488 RepID=A0A4Y8CP55_9HELO|nr:hypothetical protein BOTCAL_0481g00040 [Botryotinia calthae]
MPEFRVKTHIFDACLSWLEEIKVDVIVSVPFHSVGETDAMFIHGSIQVVTLGFFPSTGKWEKDTMSDGHIILVNPTNQIVIFS